tara:strand:- start:27946 stop:28782 length:837 start_codon:yes stop_codon:yes gene_type:complete
MKLNDLTSEIMRKKSYLCVGLDIDLNKIPSEFLNFQDPIFEFAKKIIDITSKYVIAYKPNLAFFESYGSNGFKSLEKIMKYLNSNYPEIFTIADAKRGDISNSSSMYAKAYFNSLGFDSITLSPFMGKDSIEPFLVFKNKFGILLALTSNNGHKDFQLHKKNDTYLYEDVIKKSQLYENSNRLMYVVGANHISSLKNIRKIIPNSFLLIPGFGKQGGDLEKVSNLAINNKVGLIVNSSRKILYSFTKYESFDEEIEQATKKVQLTMKQILINKSIINA